MVPRDRLELGARTQPLADFACADDLVGVPRVERSDVHELDEAYDVRRAAEVLRQGFDRVFVLTADHDAVDLDRAEPRGFRRRDAREDARRIADAARSDVL